MVIVNDTIEISKETIKEAVDADHLEKLIESKMHESLCEKMKIHLKEMSLMDIEPQEDGSFAIKASVVLDTEQNTLTTLQMLSTKLYDDYEFSEKEVEGILEIFATNNEGF